MANDVNSSVITSSVITKFTCGSCMNFAMALRKTFGYDLGYVYRGDLGKNTERGVHVVGLLPEGGVVDVRGIQTTEKMMMHFGSDMKIAKITEMQLYDKCNPHSSSQQLCSIFEDDIEHATQVIRHNMERFGPAHVRAGAPEGAVA